MCLFPIVRLRVSHPLAYGAEVQPVPVHVRVKGSMFMAKVPEDLVFLVEQPLYSTFHRSVCLKMPWEKCCYDWKRPPSSSHLQSLI